jgi:hypothetical protein
MSGLLCDLEAITMIYREEVEKSMSLRYSPDQTRLSAVTTEMEDVSVR